MHTSVSHNMSTLSAHFECQTLGCSCSLCVFRDEGAIIDFRQVLVTLNIGSVHRLTTFVCRFLVIHMSCAEHVITLGGRIGYSSQSIKHLVCFAAEVDSNRVVVVFIRSACV